MGFHLLRDIFQIFYLCLRLKHRLGNLCFYSCEFIRNLADTRKMIPEILQPGLEIFSFPQNAVKGAADQPQLTEGIHFLFGKFLLIVFQTVGYMDQRI